MPIHWCPAVVLNVDPDDTCMGNTLKGERCRNSVNKSDRCRSSKLLDEMATYRPGSSTVSEILDELAPLTLCLRWHRVGRRSQVEDVREKWDEAIEDYLSIRPATTRHISTAGRETQARERDARDGGRDTTTSATHRARPGPPLLGIMTPPVSPSSSQSDTLAELSHLRDLLASLQAQLASQNAQLASQQAQILALSSPSRSRTESPARRQVRESRSQAPDFDRLIRNMRRSMPLPTPSPSRTHTPRRTLLSTHTHSVQRRPITDDCPICYESMPSIDGTVWCRAQCGQSVHSECFDSWQEASRHTAEETGVLAPPLKCVYCRAVWHEE